MLDHTDTVQIDKSSGQKFKHEIAWHQIEARSKTSCAPLFGAAGIENWQYASKMYDFH